MSDPAPADNWKTSNKDFSIKINTNLGDIGADEWNALRQHDSPFTRHEFLRALEQNGCLHDYGWYPCHITLRDKQGILCAALLAYIKTNNYGEFVFDWAWEQAYASHGIDYYPKIVSAIPYTPITCERFLCNNDRYKNLLINAALEVLQQQNYSGMHWLFLNDLDRCHLASQHRFAFRLDCQYHWHNNEYHSFDDFLSTLRSKKRKMIQRERRLVREQKITISLLHGNEISSELWQQIHALYSYIFNVKSGLPTLSRAFFEAIGQTMPRNIVVALAMHRDQVIACAINLRSSDTLYGRHWGVKDYHDCLHFESCYYAGIEYCIRNKLKRFEPGAQGEHKLVRGFLPTATSSAHWLAHPGFMKSTIKFCLHEQSAITQYIQDSWSSLPYRDDAVPISQPAQLKIDTAQSPEDD